jgi:hypothetical protein
MRLERVGICIVSVFALGAVSAAPALAALSAPPTVTRVTPEVALPGERVELDGSELAESGAKTTTVRFGEAIAPIEAINPGLIVTVPSGTGTVDVTVTTPEGTSEVTPADRFNYADPPEYGRCETPPDGGALWTKRCTYTFGPLANYEWLPALDSQSPLTKTGFGLAATKKVKLETASKTRISCAGAVGSGDYTGIKAVSLSLSLSGCEAKRLGVCQSLAAAPGEVVTSALVGELGRASELSDVGLQVAPAIGETFAEMSCGATPIALRGSFVIPQKPLENMTLTVGWKAKAKQGVQRPTSLRGGAEVNLQAKVGEAAGWEDAGLTGNFTQTNEEAIEINDER